MPETAFDPSAWVRRQWLPLVAGALAGALVAGGVALARPAVTTANVRVLMENRLQVEFPGSPIADSVAGAVRTPDAIASIAKRAGVDAAVVDAGVRFALVPAPLYGVDVSYRSSDAGLAERIAEAGAEEVRVQARALSGEIIDRFEARVAADEGALKLLEAAAGRPGADLDTELQFRLWTVRQTAADDSASLKRLLNAYRIAGPVTTATTSPLRAAGEAAAGGAVAGLLAGVAVGWWRDRPSSRA